MAGEKEERLEIARRFVRNHPEGKQISIETCLEDVLLVLHADGKEMMDTVGNAWEVLEGDYGIPDPRAQR
jgi:hypothetical protein